MRFLHNTSVNLVKNNIAYLLTFVNINIYYILKTSITEITMSTYSNNREFLRMMVVMETLQNKLASISKDQEAIGIINELNSLILKWNRPQNPFLDITRHYSW